jgi:hypothetical protein
LQALLAAEAVDTFGVDSRITALVTLTVVTGEHLREGWTLQQRVGGIMYDRGDWDSFADPQRHGRVHPAKAGWAVLRPISARVLGGMLASRVLDDEQQDRLAEELLWPDKARYVYPLGWLGSTFIEIDLPLVSGAPRQRTVHAAERYVWPPLRSWVAERVLAPASGSPHGRSGSCP